MVRKVSSKSLKSKSLKNPASAMVIRELVFPDDADALRALIKQLNKSMTNTLFKSLLTEMLARGYRCAGAFKGDTLIGAAGFWIGFRFWCRKYIDIDNVIVDEKTRSKGIGGKLLAWIEKEGKKQDCEMAMLDCYTTHHKSHRFYFREGYSILGYHFTKDL